MHILFFSDHHPDSLGGVQTSLILQKKYLERAGHKVTVVAARRYRRKRNLTVLIEVPSLPLPPTGAYSIQPSLHLAFRKAEKDLAQLAVPVDVVHIQADVWNAILGAKWAIDHNLPVVQTMHTNLQVAFFDQLRDQLDDQKSVADNVSDGSETVLIGGKSRHVIGYLQDFLFDPERARLPVRFLSGGERNRVLLARHFAKPANVIVLDEPTNDLDTETLELLEERLMEFSGTVLVVSHDRAFLDNVATSLLVFEPSGPPAAGSRDPVVRPAYGVKEYVGGYSDWLRQKATLVAEAKGEPVAKRRAAEPERAAGDQPPTAVKKRKLSFKEQQELAALPVLIDTLETEIATAHAAMAAADYFRQPGDVLARDKARLDEAERRLAEAYGRWETLEGGAA